MRSIGVAPGKNRSEAIFLAVATASAMASPRSTATSNMAPRSTAPTTSPSTRTLARETR
nr:hypothetical protein [Nannocystis pusilla]